MICCRNEATNNAARRRNAAYQYSYDLNTILYLAKRRMHKLQQPGKRKVINSSWTNETVAPKARHNESLPTGWPDSRRLYTGACKFFTMCTEEPRGQTFNRPKRGCPRPLYTRRNDAGQTYIFRVAALRDTAACLYLSLSLSPSALRQLLRFRL